MVRVALYGRLEACVTTTRTLTRSRPIWRSERRALGVSVTANAARPGPVRLRKSWATRAVEWRASTFSLEPARAMLTEPLIVARRCSRASRRPPAAATAVADGPAPGGGGGGAPEPALGGGGGGGAPGGG